MAIIQYSKKDKRWRIDNGRPWYTTKKAAINAYRGYKYAIKTGKIKLEEEE